MKQSLKNELVPVSLSMRQFSSDCCLTLLSALLTLLHLQTKTETVKSPLSGGGMYVCPYMDRRRHVC